MAARELMIATLMTALLSISTAATASTASEESYRKRFPAQWLERQGEIRLDTICYNYPGNSYMYRLCRQQAAQTLQQRCSRYRALAEVNTGATRAHHQRMADKYCRASEHYQPLPEG
jgi:hypothetical protein